MQNRNGWSPWENTYIREDADDDDTYTFHALADFVIVDGIQHATISNHSSYSRVVRARFKCAAVARIFIRRRLVARNRDVSWLVALEIWTTRTDQIWEE